MNPNRLPKNNNPSKQTPDKPATEPEPSEPEQLEEDPTKRDPADAVRRYDTNNSGVIENEEWLGHSRLYGHETQQLRDQGNSGSTRMTRIAISRPTLATHKSSGCRFIYK